MHLNLSINHIKRTKSHFIFLIGLSTLTLNAYSQFSVKKDCLSLKYFARIQSKKTSSQSNDIYDPEINSPKSVLFVEKQVHNQKIKWLYINNLEGGQTTVYDFSNGFKKIATIKHSFSEKHAFLFHETNFPGYSFKSKKYNQNIFTGKPVEMCLSNNKKFLWIPYYRRDYDLKSIDPSAVALIDVDLNKIIRVFPSAPLPKMIASSDDGKFLAITNWGDNTVHTIDISSGEPNKFEYKNHFTVDYKLNLDFSDSVDRDNECGLCLRGTVFTPDNKYLLVSRMGGGGIAVFDMIRSQYLGTVFGTKTNVRHMVINGDYLYLSSNKDGVVQKTNWRKLIIFSNNHKKNEVYQQWATVFTGYGARTICVTSDGSYLFATANDESKISIVRTRDMMKVGEINTDSYPVGMAIDSEDKYLAVTAQGKSGKGGGNVVTIYQIVKP